MAMEELASHWLLAGWTGLAAAVAAAEGCASCSELRQAEHRLGLLGLLMRSLKEAVLRKLLLAANTNGLRNTADDPSLCFADSALRLHHCLLL